MSGGSVVAKATTKNGTTFGSWGEWGVIAVGDINNLASGATLSGGNSGSKANGDFSYLTFANNNKNNLGNFNTSMDKITSNKNALINKIETSNPINYLPDSPITGEVYVKVNGNLTIDKNLEYVDEVDANSIPKLMIYATGDINIKCNVTRIDAILIADKTVNTCSDATDKDDRNIKGANASTQLTINGMVIANKLELNRTYGAATGSPSGCENINGSFGADCMNVPAEIINYDTTMELLRIKKDDEKISGLNSVYLHELAPRL